MEASAHHITPVDINKLARNHPVAVVVGAAGFIGSHLVDHLLKLKIQVIGIDDLSRGKVENLHFASQSENFFFYHAKIEDEQVRNVLKRLPRLDYAFFVAKNENSESLLDLGVQSLLEVVSHHHLEQIRSHQVDSQKPKILLLSSVELYDNKRSPRLGELESAEITFAKFAGENGLNARVVRLGEVFGPRMHLDDEEVFSRLINAAVEGSLARENPTQDFSTRGIYIDDAINLTTKAILLGASANKIFDGIQLTPLKVEEVKQVLLDPKWYQDSDFKFAQLPPWESPNLKRTVKELSWKPRTNIIAALKETLHYFSTHPLEKVETASMESETKKFEEVRYEAPTKVEQTKVSGWSFKETENDDLPDNDNRKSIWPIFNFLIIWVIILLGLVYPIFVLIAGNFIIPNSLKKVENQLLSGDFKDAKEEISVGFLSAKEQENIVSSLVFLKTFGLFNQQISSGIELSHVNVESFQNVQQTISLVEKFVTDLEKGNLTTDSASQFDQIEVENEQNLADSLAKNSRFGQSILGKVDHESLQFFYNTLIQTKLAEQILPKLLSGQGSGSTKQYLVILQDTQTSRPTGGLINGLVLVKVGDGKVINISTLSLDELDNKLPANLVPEDFIKTSLNISNLKLSNSNFDGDYPTFARTFESLYMQATGEKVDGVLSVNTKSTSSLIESLEGVTLDSGDKIVDKDQVAALVSGSDSTKKVQLVKQILTKMFGVSNQNIFKVGQSLAIGLNQKDIQVFVNESDLENKFTNNGWSGTLASLKDSANNINDLIAAETYEFNTNSSIKKEFNDQVTLDLQGVIRHDLEINFTEQADRSFNGQVMVFLPIGVKINKVTDEEGEITEKIKPLIKYGLSEVSLPLSINSGQSQTLVLSYQLSNGLNLGQGSGNYKYQVLKQSGSDSDLLSVTFNYPEDVKITNNLNPSDGVGNGQKIQTDLNIDRQFQLTFKK